MEGGTLLLRLPVGEHADGQAARSRCARRSAALAAEAERSSPEEFKRRYEQFLADVQAHL